MLFGSVTAPADEGRPWHPHSATEETANMLMLERELRLPDQLESHPPTTEFSYPRACTRVAAKVANRARNAAAKPDRGETGVPRGATAVHLERLGVAHEQTPEAGRNPKLQAKFVGPYPVLKAKNLSGRATGSVLHPEQSKAEALPCLSRKGWDKPGHS